MDADDLYGLALERFVAERGALARALRRDGDREQASHVAGLRKPSVAAWAVNQLVRTQSQAVAALFDAGDALREAQAELVAGRGDPRDLRAGTERERAAVDELVSAARGLLTSDGHELTATVLDRVADTMHAAALDDDARRAVRDGRLERELRHVGLGVGAGGAEAGRPAPKRAAPARAIAKRPAADRDASDRAAAQRAAADRAAAERDRAAARKAARIAASEAGRVADRAGRALRVAEERRERAAQSLSEADGALATARAAAEASAEAHRRAQQALDSD